MLVALVLAGTVHAQDVIIKKNGDEIQAKVEEIGTAEVKYKRFGSESGPVYVISKSEVIMIKYADGTKDIFEQHAAPTLTPVSPATIIDSEDATSDKKSNFKKVAFRFGIGYGSGSLVGEPGEESSWTGTETWNAWHLSVVPVSYKFSPYIGWDICSFRVVLGEAVSFYFLTGLSVYTPTLGKTNIKGYASFKFGYGFANCDYVTYSLRKNHPTIGWFTIEETYPIRGITYDFEIGLYLFKNLAISFVNTVHNNNNNNSEPKFSLKFPEFRIAFCL